LFVTNISASSARRLQEIVKLSDLVARTESEACSLRQSIRTPTSGSPGARWRR